MRWLQIAAGKSGAREVAAALLIFWVYIVGWMLWWLPKEDVAFYKDTESGIRVAVFAFAGAAFGLQAVFNRIGSAPPPPVNGKQPGQNATRRPIPETD